MGENPQDFGNLHPRDFYRQFDRRADEDDKTVVSEAPYRIRQQLSEALWAERDTAQKRALETYKKLFIDHHLAQVDHDRLYYLGKIADTANDQDRERYITALVGRLRLSGDVGLLYKEDAERLIENIPSDLDIFSFNREFANDPAQAQRLLLNGAYPNIRPELRYPRGVLCLRWSSVISTTSYLVSTLRPSFTRARRERLGDLLAPLRQEISASHCDTLRHFGRYFS